MFLPQPDELSLTHSNRVTQYIKDEIHSCGGAIPFARFMQLALYAPGLGYYSAGCRKFGPEGDFITAPELSPLFSQCLANQCVQVIRLIRDCQILEFGAGTGTMAAEILLALEKQKCLPKAYLILEVSAELKERQRTTISTRCPHLLPAVSWLNALPATPFDGIILANEVLDAMPVQRFHITRDYLIQEYYVGLNNGDFAWQLQNLNSLACIEAIQQIQDAHLDITAAYNSEINMNLPAWLNSLSSILAQGLVLLIDYGYPQHEYYHPQRTQGTLTCHFRHHAHANPLILAGIQDITAHVDFSTLARYATKADFAIAGYTSQAAFLLNCGLEQLIPRAIMPQLAISNQLKRLTLPTEMGELFKAIALTKGIKTDLIGFSQLDRRFQL